MSVVANLNVQTLSFAQEEKGQKKMKNTLTDLNNYLFEALERINDDSLTEENLEKEIKRADATNKVAKTIIDNAQVQLQAMKHMDEYGYNQSKGERVIPAMLVVKES